MSIQGLPKGIRRKVRDAFVLALKNDPRLANNRVVKTWFLWDGESPIAEPTEAMMPAVQIRMLGGPVKRLTGNRSPGGPIKYINESTITMLIDTMVKGTDEGDSADLADLIYSALDPQDAAARSVIQLKFLEAGIKDWQLTREILPASAESFSQTCIVGQGSYQLTLQFYS